MLVLLVGCAPRPVPPSKRAPAIQDSEPAAAMPVEGPPAQPADVPRVTATFRDADIRDVVLMLARAGKASVVIGPDVRGTITLSVHEAPWDEVLAAVVKTLGYVLVREDSGRLKVGP